MNPLQQEHEVRLRGLPPAVRPPPRGTRPAPSRPRPANLGRAKAHRAPMSRGGTRAGSPRRRTSC